MHHEQDALIFRQGSGSRLPKRSVLTNDLYWSSDAQMAKFEPFFPKLQGKQRMDDKRVLSGLAFNNRNGLLWRDAPKVYGPHKTLYSR